MGTKAKQPFKLESVTEVKTLVEAIDELPAFRSFIDIPFERINKSEITRLFFNIPTEKEIIETVREREGMQNASMMVISARMPYMLPQQNVVPCLSEYSRKNGLNEDFIHDLIRLVINYFVGKNLAMGTISDKLRALRVFIDYLPTSSEELSQLTISRLDKKTWLNFVKYLKVNYPKDDDIFNDVRGFFNSHSTTSLNGWLKQITFIRSYKRLRAEHTSELADSGYSDSVMYQILALSLEGFKRRIGYLKRYAHLTEADMPEVWLNPGFDYRKVANGVRRIDAPVDSTRNVTEFYRLVVNWLNDENEGYQILIDHFILQHKLGHIQKPKYKTSFSNGIFKKLQTLGTQKAETRPLIEKFMEVTANLHGLSYPLGGRTIWQFYINKKSATEINTTINQIGWCLCNLLMMQTGINREVALSIPSKGEDGRSILDRNDSLFVVEGQESTEAELYGFKERTGATRRKRIPFSIPKSSPLYEMMVEYERYAKVDSSGPFFEFNSAFITQWAKAGGITNFKEIYPILNDDQEYLTSINSTRFRKVFASGQLLDRIKNIKNPNELAAKLREDLNHEDFDTTIVDYLFKTNKGRSVIDIAIATITSEKLSESLNFKGTIELSGQHRVNKKVFLCDCEDPWNPSHDVAIAAECRHYDLCLGCERSVITEFHLPYICKRIMQYESARTADPHIWSATHENLWAIAHDALNQYAIKDPQNGQRLVDEAWNLAIEGKVSLPPIIMSNRM